MTTYDIRRVYVMAMLWIVCAALLIAMLATMAWAYMVLNM